MTTSSSPSVHDALRLAEFQTRRALERLDENTEYLRDEVECLNGQIRILLEKMNHDAALERDRAFLLSLDPPPEGLRDWIGGGPDDG